MFSGFYSLVSIFRITDGQPNSIQQWHRGGAWPMPYPVAVPDQIRTGLLGEGAVLEPNPMGLIAGGVSVLLMLLL